jgi:1,4-alpha-glucan branching enzyme
MYAYSENYVLPISHDEVVHGKGSLLNKIPGHRFEQLATLRAYLAYIWSHPGKQLLFMGCEFAQPSEWADGRELDWWLLDHAAHYRVHNLVKQLNAIYRSSDALWALDSSPAGFEWINADDNVGNTFSYLRFGSADRARGPVIAVAINFNGLAHDGVRLGVPQPGPWKVVLDTSGYDEYGTPSQADNVVEAEPIPSNGQPFSVVVRIAPLTALYLAPVQSASATAELAEARALEAGSGSSAEPAGSTSTHQPAGSVPPLLEPVQLAAAEDVAEGSRGSGPVSEPGSEPMSEPGSPAQPASPGPSSTSKGTLR